MNDINKTIIVGRLTRDPESNYTNSGLFYIKNLSIAVNYSKKNGDNWKDEVSFFDIKFFGKRAEGIFQYLTKGKQVAIEGELRQERWEQDGTKRSRVIINANNIQLLGGNSEGSGSSNQNNSITPVPKTQQEKANSLFTDPPKANDFEDDIPF